MSGKPNAMPIGNRQASHFDEPVTVIPEGRPICRCMSRQEALPIGRKSGRPIDRQSCRQRGRLAGLLAGRTGGRTVAGPVVGLLVGPAKW